jgi:hypothetical protein
MARSPSTAAAKPKKIVVPKTIGACADRLYAIKDEASKIKKQLDELDKERKAIQEHVINELPKSNARGVTGKVANVRVITKEVPQVKDWDAFYGYVRKTKRTDLLQRRLSDGAVGELMDQGVKVPGVESFTAVSISLTKAS